MNEHNERVADDQLRGLAMAAFHQHEASVGVDETEAALRTVRSRIEAGDVGGEAPMLRPADARERTRSWWALGAAAAVIALIAGGLVSVLGGEDSDTLVPATAPETVSTQDPDPSVETTIAAAPTTAATADPDGSNGPQTIAVDAANPPAMIEPTPFASVPLEPNPNGNRISVAIGETHVVVSQPDTTFVSVIDVVAPTDSGPTRIDVAEGLSNIAVGPGNIVYGFGDSRAEPGSAVPVLRYVAVPYAGDRVGEVVAESELGAVQYTELAASAFGHGADGVVDRTRDVNATVIGYVDESGEPITWPSDDPALVTWARNTESGADLVSIVGSDLAWELDVTRDPANGGSYTGPSAPAPTSGDRVVYSERIGASTDPATDYALNAMPVVAILNTDGSGSWVRLPDDWDVVATDVWGTVLGRTTNGVLELALLDDAFDASTDGPPPPTSDGDPEVLAIADNCVADFNCTRLANTEDGRIVAYEPTDETLRVYDSTGQTLQSEVPLAAPLAEQVPYFVHVGPEDVAYFVVQTPGAQDPSNDLIAIPLVGPNAGTEVMRYTEGLDASGDSSLIAQKAGLMSVGCCGPAVPRPTPDAPLFHYVDGDGTRIESTAPTFRLDLGDAGNNLVRINEDGSSTYFNLPTVFQYPRDFPRLVPTDDGGALATDYVFIGSSQYSVLVDFNTGWPEFGIDNADVYILDDRAGLGPVLLEPSGTVILRDDRGQFLRRSADEIGTPGWPGQVEINTTTGAVAAPGLNDYIAEHLPMWADAPNSLAVQIVQAVDANEQVMIEEAGQTVTITTTGFLDDSVAASRITVQIERGADGLLRFVSGTYGVQCQPGRGHQDFTTELCV